VSDGAGARRIDVRDHRPEDVELESVVDHLRGGGLLGHPTETVYGFGSTVAASSLERLFALKGRDARRPVLLLVPGVDAEGVEDLAWTPEARELAEVFWPGSVTLLIQDPRRVFPEGVRGVEGKVGVRRTAHPLTARLVELLGEPLTSTSANAPGEPPARRGEEVVAVADASGAGDGTWVLDVGTLPPSAPSTIVDCTGDRPRVLRAGATPVERLRCLLPEIDEIRDR
jgi:L-threonylcarbamoyladenylate synthase